MITEGSCCFLQRPPDPSLRMDGLIEKWNEQGI